VRSAWDSGPTDDARRIRPPDHASRGRSAHRPQQAAVATAGLRLAHGAGRADRAQRRRAVARRCADLRRHISSAANAAGAAHPSGLEPVRQARPDESGLLARLRCRSRLAIDADGLRGARSGVLVSTRLRDRVRGSARSVAVGGRLPSQRRSRGRGLPRHHRMACRTGMVERQSRHDRCVVPGGHPVLRGRAAAASVGCDQSLGRLLGLVSGVRHPRWDSGNGIHPARIRQHPLLADAHGRYVGQRAGASALGCVLEVEGSRS
jgi:hypothetical protein